MKKTNFYLYWYGNCYRTVLGGNIWLKLEPKIISALQHWLKSVLRIRIQDLKNVQIDPDPRGSKTKEEKLHQKNVN